MRRIHWAAEAQDAHIVEALLRGHGIGAWSFDTGIVRLDWLKTLAFGGCRVMVADADAERAHHIVKAFRLGELDLAGEDVDLPRCPRCNLFDSEDDRRPRRLFFLLLIASDPIFAMVFLLLKTTAAASWFAGAWLIFNIVFIFPGVAAWAIKSRFRCAHCGCAWRAPIRQTFAEMTRSVDNHRSDLDVITRSGPATP